MKRIFASVLLLGCAAGSALAQGFSDASLYGQNNYYGTARTVGMGNAVTAVGGDIGTVLFNPAGSAVAGYSQFTITPNVTISSISAQGTPLSGSTAPYGFEDPNRTVKPRFTLPNVGSTLRVSTGRRSGLKSWTFGFILQGNDNYLQDLYASGSNYDTSFAGYIASLAEGKPASDFDAANVFDRQPWMPAVGYLSDLASTYGGYTDRYIGITERELDGGSVGVAGGLNQKYGLRRTGTKNDFIFNAGMNISDRFFLGVNLGVTQLSMNLDEYWREESMDPSKFAIRFKNADGTYTETYFDNFRFRHTYNAEGAGVYAKFGFIALPFQGLRIGAAIQTPTVMDISESYAYDNTTKFTSTTSGYSKSPEGDWAYRLRTPLRFNAGLAYTFGQYGLFSADYELCNYSALQVRSAPYYVDDYDDLNDELRTYMGISHQLRLGAEVRPVPQVACRVGYNLTTSPEKDDNGAYFKDAMRQNVSLGLGYSGKGSFFADLAFRMHFLPDSYFLAYPDYCFNEKGEVSVLSPEICSRQGLYDILLTFGFRF